MNFKLPQIDLFSFWFGFALATIFWLIILRISRLLPKMRKSLALNQERRAIEKSFSQEHEVQKFMLRKAQSAHLAGDLFPLEKILIEPKFMSPSMRALSDEETEAIPLVYRVLPSMPEAPELTADFPALKLTFSDLLRHHQYISISGSEGAGKTTALAYLVGTLVNPGSEKNDLPVFIDYREMDASVEDIPAALASTLAKQMSGPSSETIGRILAAASAQKRLLFLIDSLDELNQPQFEQAVQWLKKLQHAYPGAKIVTTNNLYFSGSLESIGFSLFTICAWGKPERQHLLSLWKHAWQDHYKQLATEEKITGIERTERVCLWLSQNDHAFTPLDCSLYYYLTLLGAIDETAPVSLYDAFFARAAKNQDAGNMVVQIANVVDPEKGNSFTLQRYLEAASAGVDSSLGKGNEEGDTLSTGSSKGINTPINLIPTLQGMVASGLFKQLGAETFCFSHLNFYTSLRRETLSLTQLPDVTHFVSTPGEQQKLLLTDPEEIDRFTLLNWLNQSDAPLFRNLLLGSSWLKEAEKITTMRGELLKRIVSVLQDFRLPVEIRYRLLNYLTLSKDPAIASLFTYLQNNPEESVRQLCAFGLGLLNSDKYVPQLKALSQDRSMDVQFTACLSLGRLWTTASQDALIDVIFTASDQVRELACEILALHSPDGHQMLKEITETDNYLAKKAAISGLLMIREESVKPIIEKLSVEDTQWVVRDAAGFALEKLHSPLTYLPTSLMPILENPWTLRKAERHQYQLPATGFPADLLFEVLEQDKPQDQSVALSYLLTQPNAKLIDWLLRTIKQPPTEITEEAVNALYNLGKRGITLNDKFN